MRDLLAIIGPMVLSPECTWPAESCVINIADPLPSPNESANGNELNSGAGWSCESRLDGKKSYPPDIKIKRFRKPVFSPIFRAGPRFFLVSLVCMNYVPGVTSAIRKDRGKATGIPQKNGFVEFV